jgi:hypothetical protein
MGRHAETLGLMMDEQHDRKINRSSGGGQLYGLLGHVSKCPAVAGRKGAVRQDHSQSVQIYGCGFEVHRDPCGPGTFFRRD